MVDKKEKVDFSIDCRGEEPLGFIADSVERPANQGSSTTSADPGDW